METTIHPLTDKELTVWLRNIYGHLNTLKMAIGILEEKGKVSDNNILTAEFEKMSDEYAELITRVWTIQEQEKKE